MRPAVAPMPGAGPVPIGGAQGQTRPPASMLPSVLCEDLMFTQGTALECFSHSCYLPILVLMLLQL